jgi:hypothetical protein
MSDHDDSRFDELLAIRKPGAHLQEGVLADDFAIALRVDLRNYPKFARVDDGVTYPRTGSDVRQQLDVDSGAELPDYSGPYRADLRLTDFSKGRWPAQAPAVQRGLPAALCRRLVARGRQALRRGDAGPDRVGGLERSRGPRDRADEAGVPAGRSSLPGPQSRGSRERAGERRGWSTGPVHAGRDTVELSKPELVRWLLGSHEYLLQCIEAWATQIVVRYGLDVMFDIQWTLWGDSVLPGVKKLKEEYTRHHRQHRRRLDEGPPDRRHRPAGQGLRSRPSRCPSPRSAS